MTPPTHAGGVRHWAARHPAEGAHRTHAACEHLFVTSQGSAYGRFRKALDGGNALIARAAAAELEQVPLGDAIALTLLIADQEPALYDRAAVRLLARACLELRGLTLGEAQVFAAALASLREARDVAAAALSELCTRHRVRGAEQALDAYAE
jgi:hypothetical protein